MVKSLLPDIFSFGISRGGIIADVAVTEKRRAPYVPRKAILRSQNRASNPFSKSYPCYAKALGREGIKDLWLRAHGEQEDSIAAAVGKFFRQMVAAFSDRLKHPTEAGVQAAFDPDEWASKLKEAVRPALRKAVAAGAVAEWQLFKPRTASECTLLLYKLAEAERKEPGKPAQNPLLSRIDLPQNVQDAIDKYTDGLLQKPYWADMMQTTRENVTDAVNDGVKAGLTGEELTKSILDAMGDEGNEVRARNTARTESTGAMNLGHQVVREELAEEGLIKGKEWNALDDKSTRDTHAEADGQQVAVDEKFNVGGYECDFPGDPDLPPEERCSCRCLATSVPADDESLGIKE